MIGVAPGRVGRVGASPNAGGDYPQIIQFTDDFNRANEFLEASPFWDRKGGTAGALRVASNVISSSDFASDQTLYTIAASLGIPTDHHASVDFLGAVDTVGFLVIRATDFNNFIGIQKVIGVYTLYKRVAGSFTSLGTLGATSAGVRLGIEAEGTTIRAYRDGVLTVTVTVSDAALQTGLPGLLARTGGYPTAFDNFAAGELASFF